MKKIISLFQRNYDGDHLVRDEIVPGAEWVINGEGWPTQKFDGTCCMIRDGKFYKRYDAKHGKKPPPDFEPAQEADATTGHRPGWVPVKSEDVWHMAAWNVLPKEHRVDGTYELVGPKIQGNPENHSVHFLIKHGQQILGECIRTFDGIKAFLRDADIEGIVWHHTDGRMVKIKKKDFGFPRGDE